MEMSVLLDGVMVVMLGLCFGSFATAVTYRELHDIPWIMPPKDAKKTRGMSTYRSACAHCHHSLSFLDLVPVLSWLMLRGQCRYCHQKIGWFYPAIELTCLAACFLLFCVHGLQVSSLLMMASVPFLIALILVDFKRMILPNVLVLIVGGLGILFLIDGYLSNTMTVWDVAGYLASAVLYGVFALVMGISVSFVLKKDALGMGDVKFFAVAGLWLGGVMLPVFCIVSGVMGIVLGALWQKITGSKVFPFGPALILTLYSLWVIDSSFFTIFM